MWVTIIKKKSTEKIKSGKDDVFNSGTECDFLRKFIIWRPPFSWVDWVSCFSSASALHSCFMSHRIGIRLRNALRTKLTQPVPSGHRSKAHSSLMTSLLGCLIAKLRIGFHQLILHLEIKVVVGITVALDGNQMLLTPGDVQSGNGFLLQAPPASSADRSPAAYLQR